MKPPVKPGTRVRFNQTCAWPERDGCEGVVVDERIFEGRYPADKRRNRNEVLVLLDDDPLTDNRPRGWTCSTSVSALDAAAPKASPGGDDD